MGRCAKDDEGAEGLIFWNYFSWNSFSYICYQLQHSMFTVNSIIKEINELPADRLGDVYEFVHSLNASSKKKKNSRKKILSFAGTFKDMSQKDYAEFKKYLKQTRVKLFDRA